MKIIKLGHDYKDKKYICHCSRCSTVFEFDYTEATMDKDEPQYLIIDCPHCFRICLMSVDDWVGRYDTVEKEMDNERKKALIDLYESQLKNLLDDLLQFNGTPMIKSENLIWDFLGVEPLKTVKTIEEKFNISFDSYKIIPETTTVNDLAVKIWQLKLNNKKLK